MEQECFKQADFIKTLETLRDNIKRQLTSKENKIEKLEIQLNELHVDLVTNKENLGQVMNAVFESGNYDLMDKIESLALGKK